MDLFDLMDTPDVETKADTREFNWAAFVSGKPALTRHGEVAYYAGLATGHPSYDGMNLHKAMCTVPEHAICKLGGKDVLPYLVTEAGEFGGGLSGPNRAKFLVEML